MWILIALNPRHWKRLGTKSVFQIFLPGSMEILASQLFRVSWPVTISKDYDCSASQKNISDGVIQNRCKMQGRSVFGGICSTAWFKKKWSLRADWLIAPELIPGFCSMKRLGVFLLPLDGMLGHRRSFPRNLLGFPNNLPIPIYTPGWREALWELWVLPKNTTQCP